MKVNKVGPDLLKKWKWQSSPSSIRIEEEEGHHLRYAIAPPTQDALVLVSYWIDDHNNLIDNIRVLKEGLDRVIVERDEFLKELNDQ